MNRRLEHLDTVCKQRNTSIWQVLSRGAVDIKIVLDNKTKDWNWYDLTLNMLISDILRHPELPWIYHSKQDLDLHEIKDYDHLPWNYNCCRNISVDFIAKHLDFDWDWDWLSMNSDLDIHDIVEHYRLPWNYRKIMDRNDLTIEVIRSNPHVPWNWSTLTMMRSISCQDILDNMHLPWDVSLMYQKLLSMPIDGSILNVSYENALSNPKLFGEVINSDCGLHIRMEVNVTDKDYIEHKAARTIQRCWFRAITNPKYMLCQRRLHREFIHLSR
jgi:hypothetical protein